LSPASELPPLDLVVAWLPGGNRSWSLLADAPSVFPALLYADKITLICPESDDLMEVEDFSELCDAFDDDDDSFEGTVELVSMESGSDGAPIFPEIWESLAERYARAASEAIAAGRREDAIRQLARIFGLSHGAFYFDAEDRITQLVRSADSKMIIEAEKLGRVVMASEVEPDKVASAFARMAAEPGRHGLVEDPSRLLAARSREELAKELDRWARSRSIEARLGAELLGRLPTPTPGDEPWMMVAELRRQLGKPLQRFRVAMARIAQAAESDPLDDDGFAAFTESVFRTEVAPALEELEELTQEASLRSVFLSDVAADPNSYIGPALGLVAAFGAAVPALIAAAVGATTPIAGARTHTRERRRALRKHDYLFIREAERRLQRR
jgi:hypothetical protein